MANFIEQIENDIKRDLKKLQQDIKYNVDFVTEFNNIIIDDIVYGIDKNFIPGIKNAHHKLKKCINPFDD